MIQTPAYLEGINTRKDGSISLRFSTQEMTDNDKLAWLNLIKSENFGWLLFDSKEITEAPKKPPSDERKTQSQRLRDVLYVYWKQAYPDAHESEFEGFYKTKTDNIINMIKQKLV